MVFQGHRVKVCEVSKEIALKHDIRSLSQKDSFGQLNMTVLLQTDTTETLDYEVLFTSVLRSVQNLCLIFLLRLKVCLSNDVCMKLVSQMGTERSAANMFTLL